MALTINYTNFIDYDSAMNATLINIINNNITNITYNNNLTIIQALFNKTGAKEDLFINPVLYYYFVPIMILLCFVSVFVNLKVLLSIYWIRRPMSPTLQISLSLAGADAFASCLLGVGLLLNSLLPQIISLPDMICVQLTLEAFRLAGVIGSIFHLLALTGNHYLGILKPLHYASIMTNRNTKILLLILWLTPNSIFLIYFSSVPNQGFLYDCRADFLQHLKFRMVYASMFFIPFSIMLFVYGHIFLIVRKHQATRSKYMNTDSIRSSSSRNMNNCHRNRYQSTIRCHHHHHYHRHQHQQPSPASLVAANNVHDNDQQQQTATRHCCHHNNFSNERQYSIANNHIRNGGGGGSGAGGCSGGCGGDERDGMIVCNNNRKQAQQNMNKNMKAIRTTVYIIGSFFIGLMPLTTIYCLICIDCWINIYHVNETLLFYTLVFLNTLCILKTLVNPIIYAARMQEIKNASKRMKIAFYNFFCYCFGNKHSATLTRSTTVSQQSSRTTKSYSNFAQTVCSSLRRSRSANRRDSVMLSSPVVVRTAGKKELDTLL